MDERVWILVVSHQHGDNISVHKTEEGAEKALRGYIDQSWGPDDFGEVDKPEDFTELINAYFGLTGYEESYTLDLYTVED